MFARSRRVRSRATGADGKRNPAPKDHKRSILHRNTHGEAGVFAYFDGTFGACPPAARDMARNQAASSQFRRMR
jgi:hypothetical protein